MGNHPQKTVNKIEWKRNEKPMTYQVGWKIIRTMSDAEIEPYEQALEVLSPAIDLGKNPQNVWVLTAFFDMETTEETLRRVVAQADVQVLGWPAAKAADAKAAGLLPVQNENWQEKANAEFPPLHVGSFFIHTFNETPPAGAIDLKIPAGMAFGTGEHPTTSGCLQLFERLVEKRIFRNGLDMGCGSAILAIAAAKKCAVPMLAVDIDEPSVVVAAENVEANHAPNVRCVYGDGFATPAVQQGQPFDLVFANILMQPLIDMAEALCATLETGGVAVLSGFLTEQRPAVEHAYTRLGLRLLHDVTENGWVALALQK